MKYPPLFLKHILRCLLIIAGIFVLGEIGARIHLFGNNKRLFVDHPFHKGYLMLNPSIAGIENLPESGSLLNCISKTKAAGVFRVFVVGESVVAGWPYKHQVSLARQLKLRFALANPGKEVEIVTIASPLWNSGNLRSYTPEILQYKPDAILMYLGQNEYRALPSAGYFSERHFAGRMLNSSAFLRLLNSAFHKRQGFKNFSEGDQIYWCNKSRLPNSPDDMKSVDDKFEDNLTAMVGELRNNNIPVYISTLVVNQKDQKPFLSDFRNLSDAEELKILLGKAEDALQSHKNREAETCLLKIASHFKNHAITNYYLGRIAYEAGDFRLAKACFDRACDDDLLHYRPTGSINQIIRRVALVQGCQVVDADKLFVNQSPHGIIGDSLMLDHVHPNLLGYWMLSDVFYRALTKSDYSVSPKINPDEIAWESLPFSSFDSIYGEVLARASRQNYGMAQYPYISGMSRSEEELVFALQAGGITWEKAMAQLIQASLDQRDFRKAYVVSRNLAEEFPQKYEYITGLAGLAGRLGKSDEAFSCYKKAFQIHPDSAVSERIAIHLISEDKPQEAIYYLDYCRLSGGLPAEGRILKDSLMQVVSLQQKLKLNQQDVDTLNKLAFIYSQIGSTSNASKYVQRALSLSPGNEESKRIQESIAVMN